MITDIYIYIENIFVLESHIEYQGISWHNDHPIVLPLITIEDI